MTEKKSGAPHSGNSTHRAPHGRFSGAHAAQSAHVAGHARSIAWVVSLAAVSAVAVVATAAHLLDVQSVGLSAALGIVAFLCFAAPLHWWRVALPLRSELVRESRRFHTLFEAAPEGILGVDSDGIVRMANSRLLKMFGYGPADLIGRPVEVLVPHERTRAHVSMRAGFLAERRAREMGHAAGIKGVRADGSSFPVDISLSVVDADGEDLILAIVRDATLQRSATAALQESNIKLQVALADIARREESLRRIGELGELLHGAQSEPEAFEMVRTSAAQLFPGSSGGLYLATASHNLMELVCGWGASAAALKDMMPINECWAMRRGRLHWAGVEDGVARCDHVAPGMEGSLCVPLVARGEALGVLHVIDAVTIDASGRRTREPAVEQVARMASEQYALSIANLRQRESLRTLSVRDPLTGLHNRRYLEEWAEGEMRRAERAGQSLSVIALDLDHFKSFNDDFGHAGGDVVLRDVGRVLRRQVRAGDLACRLGGEELGVFLPDTSIATAMDIAERIRGAIESLQCMLEGKLLGRVTVSAGVACWPTHGQSLSEVIDAADAALYAAKADGRNCVKVPR